MLDMTNEYKQAMDIVRSWTAPNVSSVVELAENESYQITEETMLRLSQEAKARMNKKFNDVFGVNASGVRLF